MKNTILMAVFICCAGFTFAQSAKYESAMKNNISQLDSLMMKANYVELANNFTRIGDAEKTQWLPYYYASYCYTMDALRDQDVSKKDAIADKADSSISKAVSVLGKDNSETALIKAMIATVRMTVDPQNRYKEYGAALTDNLQKSETLDPTNPRPILFEAESKYYTPETYGGSKEAAKKLLDKSKILFDNFKPESDISPNWGKEALDYFLSQYK
ncbi:MAG: hypothetical protein ABI136_02990 [Ginsengibacter sp.]